MAASRDARKPRRKFPVPWGLFIVLGVYGLCVLGYIWSTYWDSPAYRAATHYVTALRLLGEDDGRSCSEADLVEGMEHVLHAARLLPEVRELAEHTEALRGRFVERKFELPPDLARHAELVSKRAMAIEQERKPWMVVGARDRAWAPDQVLEGPSRVAWWSLPGVALILAFWGYTRFSARAVRAREHEAQLKASEKEVEALGQFRRGLKPPTAPRPAPAARRAPAVDEAEEDDDTVTDVPAARPREKSPAPPSPSPTGGVKRPSVTTSIPARRKPSA